MVGHSYADDLRELLNEIDDLKNRMTLQEKSTNIFSHGKMVEQYEGQLENLEKHIDKIHLKNETMDKQLKHINERLDFITKDTANFVRESIGLPKFYYSHKPENKPLKKPYEMYPCGFQNCGKEVCNHALMIRGTRHWYDNENNTWRAYDEQRPLSPPTPTPILDGHLEKQDWKKIDSMKVDGNDIGVVGYVKVNRPVKAGEAITEKDIEHPPSARVMDILDRIRSGYLTTRFPDIYREMIEGFDQELNSRIAHEMETYED